MIVEALIEKYEAQFVVAEPRDNLQQVLAALQSMPESGSTYLVVKAEPSYRIVLFGALEAEFETMGIAGLMRPLETLNIPEAGQVLPVNTLQTSGEVEGWLRQNPDKPLIVIEEDTVRAVLVNANLAGFIEGLSLFRLHGRYSQSLKGEAVLQAIAEQYKVTCKKCHEKVVYVYQPGSQKLTCSNCGNELTW